MNPYRFLIASFIPLSLAAPAHAGGFEGSGIGTRALSMGGAYVALADDWTAGFWNPAGLAFQSGAGFGTSVDLISLRAFDQNSIANPPLPVTQANVRQGDAFLQLPGEPSRFNVTDTTLRAALPSAAGYKVWGPWAFSLGVFAPLGFAFNLNDDTIPGYHAHYDSQGYIVNYNLSVARRWGDVFSLGAGLNILDARLKRDASKVTPGYDFSSASDGRGNALQAVAGFQLRPERHVKIGFAFKSGETISLTGNASVGGSLFPLTIPGFGTISSEGSAVTSRVYNPATYTAGVAFFPTDSLTLTADWEGTDWRPTRVDATFDQPGVILQNQNLDAGWRFTNRARTGGEYRFTTGRAQTAVRWGYTWDPYAVPDSGVGITNFVDVSRHVLTGGAGVRIGSWEPAIGFAYAWGSRTADGVLYKKIDRLLTLGLSYRIS
jgi:long-chain fatty acid transport protein